MQLLLYKWKQIYNWNYAKHLGGLYAASIVSDHRVEARICIYTVTTPKHLHIVSDLLSKYEHKPIVAKYPISSLDPNYTPRRYKRSIRNVVDKISYWLRLSKAQNVILKQLTYQLFQYILRLKQFFRILYDKLQQKTPVKLRLLKADFIVVCTV